MSISQAIRRIETRETAGELGALLLEAKLVKELKPTHNRLLKGASSACAWQWLPGASAPALVKANRRDLSREEHLFGVFASRAKAHAFMRHFADEHTLCHATLGLEKAPLSRGRGCFGYQVKRCLGSCAGIETLADHAARALDALESSRVARWPHEGPIAIFERDETAGREAWHVIDRWCYIGTCATRDDIAALIADAPDLRPFDSDVYGLIAKRLAAGQLTWIACDARPSFHLVVQDAPARAALVTQPVKRAVRHRAIAPDQFALSF